MKTPIKRNGKFLFRMLCDGEQEWIGRAYDAEHAEERCFWEEPPASLCRYTLQRWGIVKLGPTMRGEGWATVYKNEAIPTH